jgi:hypothetical protein
MRTHLIFEGCTLSHNETPELDGMGGAVHLYSSHATFTDCTLSHNKNYYHAGIQGGGAISLRYSSATLTRCTLFENQSDTIGAIAATDGSHYSLDHCTVDGNIAYSEGILYSDGGSSAEIKNSILSNSTGIHAEAIRAFGTLTLHHTAFFNNQDGDILGNIPPGFGELTQTNVNGDSCDIYYDIFMDPLFVDQPAGDHHLTAESPCIDAGDPAAPPDPDETIADMGRFYFNQASTVPGPVWRHGSGLQLSTARPNPFSGQTTISYTLASMAPGRIEVFDVQGRCVATLRNGLLQAGTHPVIWDGMEDAATIAPPGMYLVRMNALGRTVTTRLVLLR